MGSTHSSSSSEDVEEKPGSTHRVKRKIRRVRRSLHDRPHVGKYPVSELGSSASSLGPPVTIVRHFKPGPGKPRKPSQELPRMRSRSWSGENVVLPNSKLEIKGPDGRRRKGPQTPVYSRKVVRAPLVHDQPVIEVYPAIGEETWRRVDPDIKFADRKMEFEDEMACMCRPGYPPRGPCAQDRKVKPVGLLEEMKPSQMGLLPLETVAYMGVFLIFLGCWCGLVFLMYKSNQTTLFPSQPIETPFYNTYMALPSDSENASKVILFKNMNKHATDLSITMYGPFWWKLKGSSVHLKTILTRYYMEKTLTTKQYSFSRFKETYLSDSITKEVNHTTYVVTSQLNGTGTNTNETSSSTYGKIRVHDPTPHKVKMSNKYTPSMVKWCLGKIKHEHEFPRIGETPGRKQFFATNRKESELDLLYGLEINVHMPRNITKLSQPPEAIAFAVKFDEGMDPHYTTTPKYHKANEGVSDKNGLYFTGALILLYYVLILLQCNRATAVVVTAFTASALKFIHPNVEHFILWFNLDYLSCLFFVMLYMAVLSDTGFIDVTGIYIAESAHTYENTVKVFSVAILGLTLLFDSTIAVLVVAPFVIRALEEGSTNPKPILMVLVSFSNVVSIWLVNANFYYECLVRRWPSVKLSIFRYWYSWPLYMFMPVGACLMLSMMYFNYYLDTYEPHRVANYEDFERTVEKELWKRLMTQFPGYGVWRTLNNKMYMQYMSLDESMPQVPLLKEFRHIRDTDLMQICIEVAIASLIINSLRYASVLGFDQLSGGGINAMLSIYLLARSNVTKLNRLLSKINWSILFMYAGFTVMGNSFNMLLVHQNLTKPVKKIFDWENENTAVYFLAIMILIWSALFSALIGGLAVAQFMPTVCVQYADKMYEGIMKKAASKRRLGGYIEYMKPFSLASTFGVIIGGTATVIGTPAAFAMSELSTQQGYHIGAWHCGSSRLGGRLELPKEIFWNWNVTLDSWLGNAWTVLTVMVFSRPSTIPFPTVWHRFSVTKDGVTTPLRVQDITEDLKEPALELLAKYFTRDEPPCRCIGINNHPTALSELKKLWRKTVADGVSVACVTDGEMPAQLVGVNVLAVASKDDDQPFQTDDKIWAKLFGAVDTVSRGVDVFSLYGVSQYLTAYGLVVDPAWRGLGIAKEILRARIPLCKQLGIKVTATVFTAAASQAAAKKAGFDTLFEMTYAELGAKGFPFPDVENDTKASKLMALVVE